VFRVIGLLRKLYNIIIHSHALAGRMKDFKAYVGQRIPLNNRTRWNSWFYILKITLKKELEINKYIKANFNKLKEDYLSL